MTAKTSTAGRPGRAEALPEGALLVATVGRPHGLRGELRLFPSSHLPERLEGLTRIWLSPPDGRPGETRVLEVKGIRLHGRAALVTVPGVSQREEAGAFVNWSVHGLVEELPPWGPDEFGLVDVLGASLFDRDRLVGEVVGLETSAGRDYFEVSHAERRVLVPAVKDWLLELDLENGRLVLALPEGLLEAQAADEPGEAT